MEKIGIIRMALPWHDSGQSNVKILIRLDTACYACHFRFVEFLFFLLLFEKVCDSWANTL